MDENNIDKSLLLEGDTSETVASLKQKTEEILKSQPKNDRRFYCDAFDDADANQLENDVVPHVVTLVGFSDFGKSTFVSSLYHYLMVNGNIDDFVFYDSDTFSGFERRAYIRNAQLAPEKRTLRTTDIDGNFLSLHFEKNNKHFELVLSDRAGEIYGKQYIADAAKIEADKGLKCSKHLVFFIDASALVEISIRISFKNKFKKLLSRMKSAGIFDKDMVIDVFFNKMDKIQDSEDEENDKKIKENFKLKADEFIENLKTETKHDVNKVFQIVSNRVNENDVLVDVFKYLVNSCESRKTCNPKVDWVTELLKS